MSHDKAGLTSCSGGKFTILPNMNPTFADDPITASLTLMDTERNLTRSLVGGNATSLITKGPSTTSDRSSRMDTRCPYSLLIGPLSPLLSMNVTDQWDIRGKGKGRVAMSPRPRPRIRSRPSSPAAEAAAATPPYGPEGECKGADAVPMESYPAHCEHPFVDGSSHIDRTVDEEPEPPRIEKAPTRSRD